MLSVNHSIEIVGILFRFCFSLRVPHCPLFLPISFVPCSSCMDLSMANGLITALSFIPLLYDLSIQKADSSNRTQQIDEARVHICRFGVFRSNRPD